MSGSIAYIPGRFPSNPGPLARYLPPVPYGVVSSWLQERLPKGTWVLDPFGAVPHLAVEAARAGYRVLVAANNPVARFLLEMAANPPAELELRAALADLAASYKGNERMEPHIRSLYMTECAKCGQTIMAEAFLWDRGAHAPFGRIYTCPHCGDAGERLVNEADVARAARFSSSGLHRARALERVAHSNDPDRAHVEEALEAYLPRAVYALFTLINKLDSLALAPSAAGSRHLLLSALLLSALDRTNTLWPHPTARARPRQLITPPRFRENNVWLALESAVDLWAKPDGEITPPVTVVTWPEQPSEESGISVFEGRLKDLSKDLERIRFGAVLAGLPRPNQAYWTLSALWAGWLWGREATAPFKSVLRRRRYDWAWHSNALHTALSSLNQSLSTGTPILGLIGETEPGFLSASMIAGKMAGLLLDGLALRTEHSQTQILWESVERNTSAPEMQHAGEDDSEQKTSLTVEQRAAIDHISIRATHAHLRQRGEPAEYIYLHAAALRALAVSQEQLWPEITPAEALQQVQNQFQYVFSYRGGFVRFGGSEHSLEIGKWWHREERLPAGTIQENDEHREITVPLADRVEVAMVRHLQKNPGSTLEEIDNAICQQLTGLLTPNLELIRVCLDSYAEKDPNDETRWQLREQDAPRTRHADLREMRELLEQIGGRLGYEVDHQSVGPFSQRLTLWRSADGEVQYAFYLLASAVFGEIVSNVAYPAGKSIIIFPGGRSRLAAYKLDANPLLRQAIEAGWRFVKFRQLRRMSQTSHLDLEILDDLFAIDPVSQNDPQIPLF